MTLLSRIGSEYIQTEFEKIMFYEEKSPALPF